MNTAILLIILAIFACVSQAFKLHGNFACKIRSKALGAATNAPEAGESVGKDGKVPDYFKNMDQKNVDLQDIFRQERVGGDIGYEHLRDESGKHIGASVDKSVKKGVAHETQSNKKNVWDGQKFYAADIGIPALVEDYGGGEVGGHDFSGSMFHEGPRGKNKPKITDKAVVKLPSMDKVERGYSEAKARAAYKAKNYKKLDEWTPWTPQEDAKLQAIYDADSGLRGRWSRIAVEMGRSVTDCSLRWSQVLHPVDSSDPKFRNIILDSDNSRADRDAEWTKKDFWDKETTTWKSS